MSARDSAGASHRASSRITQVFASDLELKRNAIVQAQIIEKIIKKSEE